MNIQHGTSLAYNHSQCMLPQVSVYMYAPSCQIKLSKKDCAIKYLMCLIGQLVGLAQVRSISRISSGQVRIRFVVMVWYNHNPYSNIIQLSREEPMMHYKLVYFTAERYSGASNLSYSNPVWVFKIHPLMSEKME